MRVLFSDTNTQSAATKSGRKGLWGITASKEFPPFSDRHPPPQDILNGVRVMKDRIKGKIDELIPNIIVWLVVFLLILGFILMILFVEPTPMEEGPDRWDRPMGRPMG